MDRISKTKRSWNMSRIRGRDTDPEIKVRTLLHGLGYRFRLHNKDLPGKPDIVLRRYKSVILVHGCFWHRHGCKFTTIPSSNVRFWTEKFKRNLARDAVVRRTLRRAGWRVLTVWGCSTTNRERLTVQLIRFLEGT
jgi:DNA mismatch endonuclease, patch repair protein